MTSIDTDLELSWNFLMTPTSVFSVCFEDLLCFPFDAHIRFTVFFLLFILYWFFFVCFFYLSTAIDLNVEYSTI